MINANLYIPRRRRCVCATTSASLPPSPAASPTCTSRCGVMCQNILVEVFRLYVPGIVLKRGMVGHQTSWKVGKNYHPPLVTRKCTQHSTLRIVPGRTCEAYKRERVLGQRSRIIHFIEFAECGEREKVFVRRSRIATRSAFALFSDSQWFNMITLHDHSKGVWLVIRDHKKFGNFN